MKKKEPKYVSHTCKNIKLKPITDSKRKKISEHPDSCDRAFMDLDLKNSVSKSPDRKYCPQCVAKGFVNPDKPPIRKDLIKNLKNIDKQSKQDINSKYAGKG